MVSADKHCTIFMVGALLIQGCRLLTRSHCPTQQCSSLCVRTSAHGSVFREVAEFWIIPLLQTAGEHLFFNALKNMPVKNKNVPAAKIKPWRVRGTGSSTELFLLH